MTESNTRTRELLKEHLQTYPKLQVQDIFKYIYQSSFGCEHLAADECAVLDYIVREYASVSAASLPCVEPLDGEYSRVHLSCLNAGLKPETLARMFCLSAKNEPDGEVLLERKLQAAKALAEEGRFPFDSGEFCRKLNEWRTEGCPAVHHSDAFRSEYRPAYRVLSKRFADFLQVFTEIDRLWERESIVVVLEGGSASGKTTLAAILQQVYDCNVFHMDDFFLRPEQRTPMRFAQIGGNVDRERFAEEVLQPLMKRETVCYSRFDCSTQTLQEPVRAAPKKLTVVEGVYAAHPAFSSYYDLAVFLDIDPAYQKKRIQIRNTPQLAERFFREWIPLENRYFEGTEIKNRCSLIVTVCE